MACWCSCSSSPRRRSRPPSSIGSPPMRCAARRRGIAAFPTRARRRNIPRKASPADPSRLRRLRVSRARERRHAGARRDAGGAFSPASRAISCGTRFMRRSCARVGAVATRLNHLQFLTIRQYLSVVFGALVSCWSCSRGRRDAEPRRRSRLPTPANGAGDRARAAADGLCSQSEIAVPAPARRAALATLSRPLSSCPQGGDRRRQRVLAFPLRALSRLRRDLGRRGAGPDLCDGIAVQLVCGPHRDRRAVGRRRAFFLRSRGSTSARASAGSAPAARRCSRPSPSPR